MSEQAVELPTCVTTADELADNLEELARDIRAGGITGKFRADVDIWFHGCDRDALRSIARMMRSPEQKCGDNAHWVSDHRGSTDIHASFHPSVLGEVETEVVREVVTGSIADLLAEEPTP